MSFLDLRTWPGRQGIRDLTEADPSKHQNAIISRVFRGKLMADLSIFRVVGDLNTAKDAASRRILASEVQKVAKLCSQAVRAYSPIRDGELRASVRERANSPYEVQIVIPETTHVLHPQGGRSARRTTHKKGVRISNATLAEILDEGRQRLSPAKSVDFTRNRRERTSHGSDMLRQADSIPDGPFVGPRQHQPTADWINSAQDALVEELNRGK